MKINKPLQNLLFLAVTMLSITPLEATIQNSLKTLNQQLARLQQQLTDLANGLNSLKQQLAIDRTIADQNTYTHIKKWGQTISYPDQQTLRYAATTLTLSQKLNRMANIPISLGYYRTPYAIFYNLITIVPHVNVITKIPESIRTHLTGKSIILNSLIIGPSFFWDEDKSLTKTTGLKPNTPFNIIFHEIMLQHKDRTKDFNIACPMGIFSPNGIQPYDLLFNQLSAISVYWHNAYSPNNARFGLIPTRTISSFWYVGINPETNTAYVLPILCLATFEALEVVNRVFLTNPTVDDIFTQLNQITLPGNTEDQSCFNEFIETIQDICSVKE